MKKMLLSAVAMTAMVAFGGNAWADLLIGVAGPLTGPNAAFGAQLQKGAEQAAADINAAGGINGEQIKIVIGDDAADPEDPALDDQGPAAEGAQAPGAEEQCEDAGSHEDESQADFYD